MPGDSVITALQDTVSATLQRWPDEGESEVHSVNEQLGYVGTDYQFTADVPPKFITGNPEDVAGNRYLLVMSLNHRYVPAARGPGAEDYCALRGSVESHLRTCLDYFRQPPPLIYGFFTNLEQVLRGFDASGNAEFDLYQVLRKQTLFIDHLPYFSIRSGDYPGILKQRAATDNRKFIETLLKELPPRAVLLSGKATGRAFDPHPDAPFGGVKNYSEHQSKDRSRVGPFRYKVGSLEVAAGTTVRVVACNFVGSIYGPNTNDQKYELGTVLAGS
jgi:hypothetical protein